MKVKLEFADDRQDQVLDVGVFYISSNGVMVSVEQLGLPVELRPHEMKKVTVYFQDEK